MATPVTTAARAQKTVDRIIHPGKPSRVHIAILTAAAAKPVGHMNIGQVSPTRSVSDFHRKYRKGTLTAVDKRMAAASPFQKPRHVESATADSTTGNSTKPTRPNCRPI